MATESSSDGIDGQAPTLTACLSSGTTLQLPDRIAHYRLGETLGEGGMGIVLAAFDEVLERDVAVKLLRADRTDARSKVKMLHEAKALAKLSHPNIVPIYGAGEERGHVYFAMERVEGRTLREVRDDDTIGWQERLALYVQAGRGLAAAHRADLVHRDFKPSNALVGRDGRVRVVDFGLARALQAKVEDMVEPSTRTQDSQTDAMAGTPAYMSPEQRMGVLVGPQADQYSFCASLWEALFHHNPVRMTPLIQLIDGELQLEVPRGSPVPAAVAEALRRGLRREPEARFPSIEALLDALESRSQGGRRGAWLAAAALVVLAGASVLYDEPTCRDEPTGLLRDDAVASLEKAWIDAGVPATSRETMHGRLAAFERRWSETRRGVCEARAGDEISAERLDQHDTCLAE